MRKVSDIIRNVLEARGFTLIELLVGVAIMSIVSLGMMKIMGSLNEQQFTTQVKYARMSNTMIVQSDLADEDACANSLAGLDPTTQPLIKTLKASSGGTLLDLTTPSTQKGDLIGLQLVPFPGDPNNFALLNLKFLTASGQMGFKPVTVRVAIAKSPTGAITRCSTFGLASGKAILRNVGCSGVQVLQGFNSSGDPICVIPASTAVFNIPAPAVKDSGF